MNKLLPILVVIMLFIAGGTGYFAVSKYLDYKNNATLKNVEVIEPVAVEEVSEIEIKEVTTNSTNKEPSNVVTKSEPNAIEVFNYAQRLFDKYTNYGATYVPEIHDDLVMRETAAYFGISVADADRLHYQGGMDSLK